MPEFNEAYDNLTITLQQLQLTKQVSPTVIVKLCQLSDYFYFVNL